MKAGSMCLALILLVGCGDGASTYDARSGHYHSSDEMRKEQRDDVRYLHRRIDELENEKRREAK